jgi:hypothetical protein
MRRRFRQFGVALLMAALFASPVVGSQDASEKLEAGDVGQQEIASLVRQLSAPRFADRQRASQRLLNVGLAAEAALRVAVQGADREVRDRARQILEQISAADFESRLEAFAADIEGKQQHHLPAWERFSNLFGNDETARGLFVEMQRAEPQLLQMLDSGSPMIADAFTQRCEDLSTGPEAFNPDGRSGPTVGSVGTILFVGVAADFKIDEQLGVQTFGLIQPMLQSGARRGPWGPLLRRMTAEWIQKDNGPAVAFQNLWLAFSFELREGLQVAERVLKSNPPQPEVAPFAALVVAKFGGREQMPLLEPLLKDTSAVENQDNEGERGGAEGEHVNAQVRDVALAALVFLSGQQLSDYGFDKSLPAHQILFQPGKYGFANAIKRSLAHKKWSQWASSQSSSGASGNRSGG